MTTSSLATAESWRQTEVAANLVPTGFPVWRLECETVRKSDSAPRSFQDVLCSSSVSRCQLSPIIFEAKNQSNQNSRLFTPPSLPRKPPVGALKMLSFSAMINQITTRLKDQFPEEEWGADQEII
jgi:hypothetical protein